MAADGPQIILGIGNPGSQYAGTRHNCGFMVVDALCQYFGASCTTKKWHALVAEVRLPPALGGGRLVLLKPQTYVNRSGQSLQAVCTFFKVPPSRALVVVDDIHLSLGTLRLRQQGSAGGHNGLRDIEQRLGRAYPRLRMGIGSGGPGTQQVGHVLGHFAPEEQASAKAMVLKARDCCVQYLGEGIEAAMRFNGPLDGPGPSAEAPVVPPTV